MGDWIRPVLYLVGGLAVFYALLCGLAYRFQDRLVYQPWGELTATPDMVGLPYRDLTLTTEDGVNIHAWFVAPDHPKGTILVCHGNAGNISNRVETLFLFHQMGYASFVFDYRGYGRSEGAPDEAGTYLDARAAWKWLTEEEGIPPGKIAVFGRSLGGGVASWLAVEHNPAALVLESAFTSVPDLGASFYPWLPVRALSRIIYPTAARLNAVRCPVLVVHSPEDEIVPYAHGRALFEAARKPKEFLQISGPHNGGYLISGDVYTDGVSRFLERSLSR